MTSGEVIGVSGETTALALLMDIMHLSNCLLRINIYAHRSLLSAGYGRTLSLEGMAVRPREARLIQEYSGVNLSKKQRISLPLYIEPFKNTQDAKEDGEAPCAQSLEGLTL